jgi:hypothetical protein
MPVQNRSRLITNAVIAAAAGGAIGALAGAWSGYRAVRTPSAQAAPVAAATAVDVSLPALPRIQSPDGIARSDATLPAPTMPAPVARSSPVAPPVPSLPKAPIAAASPDLLERAGALARRPDVTALVALRESVALRARERGDQDSPATKAQLDALDRYLDEARQLRLKLDGEQLRKSVPEPKADKPPDARR